MQHIFKSEILIAEDLQEIKFQYCLDFEYLLPLGSFCRILL